jgi:hypothetical protein
MDRFKKFAGALLVCFLLVSCNSNELADPSIELSLDKSRMDVIADVSVAYENAIIDVLNQRNRLRSSGLSVDDFQFANHLNEAFEKRVSVLAEDYKQIIPETSLRSVDEGFSFDESKLYKRLEVLTSLWEGLASLQDSDENLATKEGALNDIQNASDNFVETVKNDDSLDDVEKQIIIENIVLRTNIAIITIKYGEEIAGETETRFIGKLFRRIVKIVVCTVRTVNTITTCTTAAGFIGVGLPSFGLLYGSVCVTQTVSAVVCWSNL